MKTINFFLVFVFCLMFMASAAFAHPASQVEITTAGENVNITITHEVKDPVQHFIDEIEVSVNGKDLIDQKEIRQVDNNKQIAVYKVPGLKAGDVVKVNTECNKMGSKSATITVQ